MIKIASTCIGCGACQAVCPTYKIRIDGQKAEENNHKCIQCGQCEAVCPSGALHNDSIPHDETLEFEKYPPYTPEDTERFLRSRRSVRQWQERPVSREETARLLNMGRYAQTASNSQGVSYIVVGSRKKMQELRSLTMDYYSHGQTESQRLLYQRFCHPSRPGEDLLFRNAPMLIIGCGKEELMKNPSYVTSPEFALTYVELYAASLGLGTCFAGYFQSYLRSGCPKLRQVLCIEDDRVPYSALLYGYPKFPYYRAPSRQPLQSEYLD